MQSSHDHFVATDEKEAISPLSRHISTFNEIEKKSGTAREITIADKKNDSHDSNSSSSASLKRLYYLKKHAKNNNQYLNALETYTANICRYLATPDYIPATYLYHDDTHTIGVVSKKKATFKSNHDDPLTDTDIIINSPLLQKEHQQRILMQQIMHLFAFYETETNAPAKTLTNYCYSFFSANNSNRGMRDYLLNFRNSSIYFTRDQLDSLLSITLKRIDTIKASTIAGAIEKELKKEKTILKEIVKLITAIKKFDLNNNPDLNIITLEEFDKLARRKKLNLDNNDTLIEETISGVKIKITAADLKNYRTLKGIATTQTMRFIFKDYDNNNQNSSKNGDIVDFNWFKSTISADLHQNPSWPKILSQANIDPFVADARNIQYIPDINPSFLFYWPTKQTDGHMIIINIINKLLTEMRTQPSSLKPELLKVLANYILIIKNKLVHMDHNAKSSYDQFTSYVNQLMFALEAFHSGQSMYDVAINKEINMLLTISQAIFMSVIENNIKEIARLEKACELHFGDKKNTFTLQDNVIYKKLATHPVVVFHKYKTFLKYILSNENLYENLANLCIPSSPETETNLSTNSQKDSLREKLVNDEIMRMSEIHHTLLTMQDFKDFMHHHGEYAFKMIKEETTSYQEKYSRKLDDKPYYGSLVNAIIKNPLEEKFTSLCDSLKIARPVTNFTNTLS